MDISWDLFPVPFTMEEVVTRNFLLQDCPDVILNIVDASNLERNLNLTTQLLEVENPYGDCPQYDGCSEKTGRYHRHQTVGRRIRL